MNHAPRGIALLIAVILTSVILTVALALLDITYKQVVLASAAKQSQYAFYTADSSLECALYYDQQVATFDPASSVTSVECRDYTGTPVSINFVPVTNATSKTTTFTIPCAAGGIQGQVTVIKMITATCSGTATTCIYATGYSTCDTTDPRRIERGLKVLY